MPLTNELGIEELFDGMAENSLKNAVIFLESNNVSVLQFIGTLSLFAHTHEPFSQYRDRLKSILANKFLDKIYAELDKTQALFENAEAFSAEALQNLFDAKLSNELIREVAFTEISMPREGISFWGLKYLFPLLLEIDLVNFENWIKATPRLDLKIAFLDTIFSSITNRYIIIDNLDGANLGILQAFYALSRFNIERQCRNVYLVEENISLLFTTNLSNRSKFVIYLKYITGKYHGQKLNDLESTEIDAEIDRFTELGYDFSKEELFGATGMYYSIICFKIIQRIQNADKKQLFLETLLANLIKHLSWQGFKAYEIDYANLLGYVSLELEQCNTIEKAFEKEYKELSFPYSFCKIKNWSDRVGYMFGLLIGIYVYKKQNIEDFKPYIEKFKFIRSDRYCFAFKDIEHCLEQMI